LLEGRRAPVSRTPYVVIGDVPRFEAMELAARLRANNFSGASGPQVGAAEQVRSVDRMLASDTPPVDWHVWVDAVRMAEELRAGGSAGVADTVYYDRVQRFLNRQSAPTEAKASIAFLRGLAGWDFVEAAMASRTLLGAAARGDHWLPPDLLREGSVIALIRTGDVATARNADALLAPSSSRSPNDVRPQLLAAWILAADHRRQVLGTATPPGERNGAITQ
jgi:hypothetical protein